MFKRAQEELKRFFGNNFTPIMEDASTYSTGDVRYRNPKQEPQATEEEVSKTIEETEIYRKAKEEILKAQRKQVAYGIDKYPEPLNADSWSTVETIEHIIDETIDKLHYLVMLKIKLEREAIAEDAIPVGKVHETGHLDIMALRDAFTDFKPEFTPGVKPVNKIGDWNIHHTDYGTHFWKDAKDEELNDDADDAYSEEPKQHPQSDGSVAHNDSIEETGKIKVQQREALLTPDKVREKLGLEILDDEERKRLEEIKEITERHLGEDFIKGPDLTRIAHSLTQGYSTMDAQATLAMYNAHQREAYLKKFEQETEEKMKELAKIQEEQRRWILSPNMVREKIRNDEEM